MQRRVKKDTLNQFTCTSKQKTAGRGECQERDRERERENEIKIEITMKEIPLHRNFILESGLLDRALVFFHFLSCDVLYGPFRYHHI